MLLSVELEAGVTTPEFGANTDDPAHLGVDILDAILDGLQQTSGFEGMEARGSWDSSRDQHRQQLKIGIVYYRSCMPSICKRKRKERVSTLQNQRD